MLQYFPIEDDDINVLSCATSHYILQLEHSESGIGRQTVNLLLASLSLPLLYTPQGPQLPAYL